MDTQILLNWIRSSSWKTVSSVTGCFQNCNFIKYEISEVTNEQIFWKTEWISEVFIRISSTYRKDVIEFISYDFWDVTGDLGGYLGLFLGWSLLSMLFYFPENCIPCALRALMEWKDKS